jgi:hypothetical protein
MREAVHILHASAVHILHASISSTMEELPFDPPPPAPDPPPPAAYPDFPRTTPRRPSPYDSSRTTLQLLTPRSIHTISPLPPPHFTTASNNPV